MTNHSRERASERYNLQLDKGDEARIINKIWRGDYLFLGHSETDSKSSFVYVIYKNIPLKVLYHKSTKGNISIITTYPFDADEYNKLMDEDFKNRINMSINFLQKNGYVVYKKEEKKELTEAEIKWVEESKTTTEDLLNDRTIFMEERAIMDIDDVKYFKNY